MFVEKRIEDFKEKFGLNFLMWHEARKWHAEFTTTGHRSVLHEVGDNITEVALKISSGLEDPDIGEILDLKEVK